MWSNLWLHKIGLIENNMVFNQLLDNFGTITTLLSQKCAITCSESSTNTDRPTFSPRSKNLNVNCENIVPTTRSETRYLILSKLLENEIIQIIKYKGL